jgi:hypothetical protein
MKFKYLNVTLLTLCIYNLGAVCLFEYSVLVLYWNLQELISEIFFLLVVRNKRP